MDYSQKDFTGVTPTFTATNNSTLGFKNDFKDAANFVIKDSTLKDVKNSNGGDMHFDAHNANIGNITITNPTSGGAGGKVSGTFDSSNIGNITSISNFSNTIKITNSQGKENLKIGNISYGDGTKTPKEGAALDINLDKNATVGNIDVGKAALNATFNGASVGDIKNTNSDTANPSSITFTNTKGQSIGKIGDSTHKFTGSINGTFDFTPVTTTDSSGKTITKSLQIGDITSSSTAKNDISFVFGGKDASGNTIGKPTTPIKISGGSSDSSYTFANLGNLSTDSSKKQDLSTVSGITFGSDAKVGSLNLVGTSVSLAKGEQLDKQTISKLLGNTSAASDLKSANLVFGNAKLVQKPDGSTEIVKNTDDKGNTVFATLTQEGKTHTKGDGYVKGKSSDADIQAPTDSGDFTLKADFLYTPGTFDASKGESAWTGSIKGDPTKVDVSLNNAGTISTTQLGSTSVADLSVALSGTTLTGVLGGDVNVPVLDDKGQPKKDSSGKAETTKKAQDVTLSIDASSSNSKGLSIIGDGKHDLTLDFSGNNSKDKFTGAILGGSADSSLTIKNLDGININSTAGGSIVDGLKAAGITGINNPSAAKNPDGSSISLTDDQKKDIATSTEFKLSGSSITGNIKDTNYSYNLGFSSTPSKDDDGKTIPPASYNGTSINFSGNTNNQTLSFEGKDAINPTNHQALNITLGTGDTSLNFKDTGATIAALHTDNAGANSSLISDGTSIVGDWTKGSADVSFDSNSKFYGVIGGSSDKPIKVNLGENSLYSSSDPVIQAAYQGKLKGTSSDGTSTYATPVVDLSSTGEKELNFKNPGETLEIKGLSETNGLDSGNLIANNMSLVGNLYSKLDSTTKASDVKATLSFDSSTANGHKPTSFTTDHIGVLANGSSVSFSGEGSLKPLTPYDEKTHKGGVTTISLGGSSTGNTNFNLDNTGANVVFSQVSGQKDVKGNFDIRGTNITLDNGLSAWEGSRVNLIFANATSSTKDTLLKTKDGSLLTSKTNAAGVNKPNTDYVDSSTLTIKSGTVSLKGKENNITFIGDASVIATPMVTKPMELGGDAKANINLINMGTTLSSTIEGIIKAQGSSAEAVATQMVSNITDASTKNSMKTSLISKFKNTSMADILLASNNSGSKGTVKYYYNLAGTTLGQVSIGAPKSTDGLNQTQVYINASFDQRDLKDRDNDAQRYYSDNKTIGNTQLEIAKSALNGNLTLDGNVHANFHFYGENSLNSNAKISGGASDSIFTFRDMTLNFGAGSGFSNYAMNGKVVLNGVNASGTFNPTGNVSFVSLGENNKEINALVFKDYGQQTPSNFNNNLQTNGDLYGVNANLNDVLKIKDTHFKGSIDSNKAFTFVFAGSNSSGFAQTDSKEATKLGSNAKNVTLDLIDVGTVQMSNINAGASDSNNVVNLYGQSALSTTSKDGKTTLEVKGGDSLTINATIDKNNAKLWGADDKGSLNFDIEGTSAVNSVYNLTFNGGIPYPNTTTSFYTGNIGLLNSNSVINFIDAGTLKDTQFENTKASVNISRTTITGDIYFNSGLIDFTNNNKAFSGNVVYKDASNNVKDLIFDFSNNNQADKIENKNASDHNYYLAGGSGSKFTFVNLTDNHSSAASSPIQWQASNTQDGIFNTLGFNGVHFRAADASRDKKILLGNSVAQSLDDNTTFAFAGTSISGDINTKYNLDLSFYNLADGSQSITSSFDKNTKVPLNKSFYSGSSISTKGTLNLTLYGAGALGNTPVTLHSDKVLNVNASSDNGEIGSIITSNVAAGSGLWINHLGFSGDFLSQKDTSGNGGIVGVTFENQEVQDGFILGSKDNRLIVNLSNTTLNEGKKQVVIIGSGNSKLNFSNSAPVYIHSTSDAFKETDTWDKNYKGTFFADGSSIISRGTSIIGNIYTNNKTDSDYEKSNGASKTRGTYYDLAFSSIATSNTPASFYAGSYIGVGANNSNTTSVLDGYSKIAFDGRGSLKSISKDKDGNEVYTDVKNIASSTTGADLKASDVNLTIAVHDTPTSTEGSMVSSINISNTGGVLQINEIAPSSLANRLDLQNFYSLSLRGVSLYGDSFTGGLFSFNSKFKNPNESQKFQMTFSNGDGLETIIKDSDKKTISLNDSKLGKDYIESSSYGIKSFKSTQGNNYLAPKLTFIGSASHNFFSSKANSATAFFTNYQPTKDTSNNNYAQINFINADNTYSPMSLDAFNTTVTVDNTNSNNEAINNNDTQNTGIINLIGTTLGSNDLSKTAFILNANFDQRGDDTYFVKDAAYVSADNPDGFLTTDGFGALSSSILKVRKAKLDGDFKLGDKVEAHFSFLGNDAFTSKASISGGTSNSTLDLNGTSNLSYTKINAFGGTSTIVNTTFDGDIKDNADTAGSSTSVMNAYFNSKDTNITSDQAKTFIKNYNDSVKDTMALDLSTEHTFNANVGKTAGVLQLSFIGATSTGSNFKISNDDNIKNIYSFVDYGKIDLSTIATDGKNVKGTIKWIGNSYQVGKVENAVNANVDMSVTGDDIKNNEYIANGGVQDITFDFGGSANKPDGSKKEIGVIKDATDTTEGGKTTKGGATSDSTYTVANLTDGSNALSTDSGGIINTINHTLNNTTDASKNPFQNTVGTIGISGTNIQGDLNQDKNFKGTDGSDSTFNGTIQATFDSTEKNPSHINGNIKGDATKDITFIGENSSDFKDGKVISGGDKDSKYSFQDAGSINTSTLNNILSGGSNTNGSGYQSTAGTFNFDGSTTIAGDIKDAANTTNAKDQTINIGKNKDKSPNGVVYQGEISTTSKVDAIFGVGSSVNIKNENENSVYDFSKFSGSSTAAIADIDLGDKQAKITGFNGNTSLIGSINDQNSGNTYTFSGGNGKTAGHWILTKDSSVNKLVVQNDFAPTSAILEASSANNPFAVIDLTGRDANTSNAMLSGANHIAGASIVAATPSANNNGGYLNLTVNSLDANNAIFRLGVNLSNSDQDPMITVNSVTTSTNRVNYLQFYPQGGGSVSAPILVANVAGTISTSYFKGAYSKAGLRIYTPEVIGKNVTDKGMQAGGLSASPDTYHTEFYLNSLVSSVNTAVVAPMQQSLSSAYRNFRVETNNLHLRMGELRGIGATQGAWARIMNGMGSDDSNRDIYTTIQAGYDYKFDVLGGVNYVGVVADTSIINSEGSDYKGLGNTLGLGIYNTYLMDNGLYVDAITKYLYMHNKINSAVTSEQILGNSAFLLGGEVGYRYKLDNVLPYLKIAKNIYTQGFYIEPQVELIYGYIAGNNFNTSLNSVSEASTISATLDGNNALISRVGAVIGKEIRTSSFYGDIRLGISYVNELNTGGSTSLVDTMNPQAITSQTPSNNKLALSLGTNVKINEDWRVYADIGRTFFGIYNIDYNINLGGRWNFGKKTSSLERNIKAQKQAEAKKLKEEEKIRAKQQAQQAKVSKAQPIKAAKILSISEAKTKCQGCAPESGYYLRIVTISSTNANLEKQLKGHSFRVYSFKDSKNRTLHSYLAGPYQTQSDIDKAKTAIDKIAQWANNNKKIQSEVYEVKNNRN
ncbi:hypothetical protein [Helicobacter cappadocius]|uniref:Autotransporter domain-containing protein n=1 Tax=Helicobacter cappadocius TaxID=3063998 RepID=A0AA90PKR7_9HELI|nr:MULTISPECIES: hypothetical protein [unclassified Helicobacter]MDO7253931.1 hypothetical protein [Helicobacter sp. faydin-H75]MDP2539821.1 hypothetical protein [Helicobacter sp. faydin-H76]